MRRLFLVIPLVFACAKSDAPKPDAGAPAPTAPAALTEADLAGTWKGTTMPVGSDSVVGRWTQICAAGACKGITEGSKDTAMSTYVLAGDSSTGVSAPYTDPTIKGGKVISHWVVRLTNGMATGTGHFNLASKPDSVLIAYHFAGSRAP